MAKQSFSSAMSKYNISNQKFIVNVKIDGCKQSIDLLTLNSFSIICDMIDRDLEYDLLSMTEEEKNSLYPFHKVDLSTKSQLFVARIHIHTYSQLSSSDKINVAWLMHHDYNFHEAIVRYRDVKRSAIWDKEDFLNNYICCREDKESILKLIDEGIVTKDQIYENLTNCKTHDGLSLVEHVEDFGTLYLID